MRTFMPYFKKTLFIFAAIICFSFSGLQGQVAETATLVLPQIVQLAAAILYRATISHGNQQPNWTPPSSTSSYQSSASSFYMPGSSSAHNPLDAIRFQGVQGLRQNQQVIDIFERYKSQILPFQHKQAHSFSAGGTSIPHGHGGHGTSVPATDIPAEHAVPFTCSFPIPSTSMPASVPATPTTMNIPRPQGEFRLSRPAVPSWQDVGVSASISVNRQSRVSMPPPPIQVNGWDQAIQLDPVRRTYYNIVFNEILAVLFNSNNDLIAYPRRMIARIDLANQSFLGSKAENVDRAINDLLYVFFDESGNLKSVEFDEGVSPAIFECVKHVAGKSQVARVVNNLINQGSQSVKRYMINLVNNGYFRASHSMNGFEDFKNKILSNKNNQLLKRIDELLAESVNKNGSIDNTNNFYDAEDLKDYLSPQYRTIAQRFMDQYFLYSKDKSPEIHKQIRTIDRYGMPRTYSKDPRWANLSSEEKQNVTSAPDSKTIMKALFDSRQTIGNQILQDAGFGANVLDETSGVSKSVWNLVDHVLHPTEISQARIAQAFDPKTYRFKYGNEKLEEMLKKAFDSEQEFKAAVDQYAGQADIPYSPGDLDEPVLEPKPKMATSSGAGAIPYPNCPRYPFPHEEEDEDVLDLDLDQKAGAAAAGGGRKPPAWPQSFATTGGPNDDPERPNCDDEKKEINQSDKTLVEFICQFKKLPNNYITKIQARNLGWNPKLGNLNTIAPGKSIGGDIFNNAEHLLPDVPGRTWYEADLDYKAGFRGCERIIFSNDGLFYKTVDHYKSFIKIE